MDEDYSTTAIITDDELSSLNPLYYHTILKNDTEIIRIKKIVSDYGLVPTKAFIEDYANRCRTSLDTLPYSHHWKAVFSDMIEYLMGSKF